jgi:signal transduction histidine kinase/ligand-binding sensor domain-containing protein
VRRLANLVGVLVAGCGCGFALNPSLDISQYAHHAWTVRDGFSLGNIYAIAQTPDGYLWFGTEFGLFRFDGIRASPWQPPAGQHLPEKNINALLVTRDGALWIGTFAGLATWRGGKLSRHPVLGDKFVASLFEDSEQTVWAGTLETSEPLCAIRGASTECYPEGGAFGRAVWAFYEDSSGNLWAGAGSGIWRWKPGPPKRYATPLEIIGLSRADDGRLLAAMHTSGLMQLAGEKAVSYPLRGVADSDRVLPDRDVNSNKLLRDRDGGLWIGTVDRGLVHVHHGRTDVYSRSDGLSGDIVLSLLEDREGNVWVATTGGLDRFRERAATTMSVKQGLSSDATHSVLAASDGSVWIATHDGLTRWNNGETTIFRKASGLPDDAPQSLFQDHRGRIWAFTGSGLAYFRDGRFVAVSGVRDGEAYSITGDKSGNLWLSGNRGLSHLVDRRLVEHFPWAALGRRQQAKVVLSEQGGVWLSFWLDGGVSYFKDGQVRASYTAAHGLGNGFVPGLQFDREGALWAATQSGLSRIKDGGIATLTSRNGLPCDTIHWTIEDDDRAFWLYGACGLVRIKRTELEAWIADPQRRIQTTVWDAADGVRVRSSAASPYGPTVAKATDGRLWFVTGEGVQVVDPRDLAVNKLPPPVCIEQVVANRDIHWQNMPGTPVSDVRLPPLVRDLHIDYTALSLAAPEKVRFKYKLEGQDRDWKEVINERQAQYTNLSPGQYRFRVIASNNSGVWNEAGDSLEFSVAPAYYQTKWFRALCAAVLLAMLWAAHQVRVRRLHREFNLVLEGRVEERMRIARELHDTLLQSFQGLLLPLQGACNLLPGRAPEARQVLEKTIDNAARAVTEARDAVQGLRSFPILCGDLVEGIKALGQELASRRQSSDGSAPAFSVEVEGQPHGLDPAHRDEIYRVAGEALRNAFQHARARHIEVEIRYDTRRLRVRVRDDGIGIAPEVLQSQGRAGHWGLKGIRERTKRIGGQLGVWSERGAGTEVELILPASIAYAEGGRRGFWLRKRRKAVQL